MDLPEQPELVQHGVTDSTNERAFAALADGTARHGQVHTATFQTQGRGRLGRHWVAQEGQNLLMSAVLAPPPPVPNTIALTMAVSLAVSDAAAELGAAVHLKWPNDVLCGRAKLSGILVETRGLDPAAPRYVVGVGMNVGQREFPAEVTVEREVTSLAMLGIEVTVERVLHEVWTALRARFAQSDSELAARYLERLKLGERVSVRDTSGVIEGEIVSLHPESGLELRLADGSLAHRGLEFVSELRPA